MKKTKLLLLMLLFVLTAKFVHAQSPIKIGTCTNIVNGVELRYALYSNNEATLLGTTGAAAAVSGPLTIPSTVVNGGITYPVTKIEERAFLSYLHLSGTLTIPSSVKEIGQSAFAACKGFTGLVLQNGVEYIRRDAFTGCSGMHGDLTIPASIKSVENYAFAGTSFEGTLTILAQVQYKTTASGYVIPNSVFGYRNYAFSSTGLAYDLGHFTRLVFGGPEPSALLYAEAVTYNNVIPSQITSVTFLPEVQKIPPKAVEGVDLSKCTELVFPPNVREIGHDAFAYAKIPTHITIPSTVTTLGSRSFAGTPIVEMTVQGPKTEIPAEFCSICRNLVTVNLPNTIKSIGIGAFQYCSFANFPWLPALEEIKMNAFSNCTNITDITFPSTLKRIENEAFKGCTGLRGDASGFIPASLTYLGAGVFADNKGITGEAVLPSTMDTLREGQSTGNPFARTRVYGLRMGNWPGYFAPANSFNHRDNWGKDEGLLYIDARYCTLMLTNVKHETNEAYKFSRRGYSPDEYHNFGGASINTLVYLPSETLFQNPVLPVKTFDDRFGRGTDPKWDADGENFIMDGKCKYFCVVDGLSYRVPIAFTALEAQYNRTFDVTDGKAVSTLYLPYPTDLPTGMRAYYLSRKGVDGNNDKAFMFELVPEGSRLEANKPYIVQITDGQTHKLPTMYNVEVPVSPGYEASAVAATNDADWKFYGTTEKIENAEAVDKKAYYLNGNKWWLVKDGVNNDYIAPFRAFICSPSGAVPSKSFAMVLDGDSNVAGVKQMERATQDAIKSGKYTFYSVDGKALGNDYDKLDRGQIYIVNGNKFYKF